MYFATVLLDIWPKGGIKVIVFHCIYSTDFKLLKDPVASKTEAKYIHLKMLSATGRTSLPVRSFCPPPVIVTMYHENA